MTRSLQIRLLWGLAIGTSLVLVAAGAVLYALIRAELIAEFDAALAAEARALATLVEEKDGRIQTEMAEHGVAQTQASERPIYYQVMDRAGKRIEGSSRLQATIEDRLGGPPEEAEFDPVVLPGGVPGRMVAIRVVPHQDDEDLGADGIQASGFGRQTEVTLELARDTLELEHTLRRIGLLLAGVFGGAVVVSLLVAAPIVRIGLRPLQVVSAQITSLDPSSLAERLNSASAPDEVRCVIDCLNGLLDRLHEAFQRERAFSANVAHELRTPLAGLRATIDVALSKPRPADDFRKSLTQCLTICQQAESLTENLLVLARLDAGQCQVRREAVEITELLRKAWAPLASRADDRGLGVEWQLDEPIELGTDATLLALIARNLLDNAVSYADEESQVEIAASVAGGAVVVKVRNAAGGLPPDLSERAFDRFWRGDASRTGTGRHAGLGLSLCQQAAAALGGKLTIAARNGSFSACLHLPATTRQLHENLEVRTV